MGKRPVVAITSIVLGLSLLVSAYWVYRLEDDPWIRKKGAPGNRAEVPFFTREETPLPTGLRALPASKVTREQADGKLSFIWAESEIDWERAEQIGRIPPHYNDDETQVVTLPGGGRIQLAWATMGYDPDLKNFPVTAAFASTSVTVRGDTWEPLDAEQFERYQSEDLKLASHVKPQQPKWPPGAFSLDLNFLHEGLPDFLISGNLFLRDLETMNVPLLNIGGNFKIGEAGHFHTVTNPAIFHPARLEAGFDVAYGPCEEIRLPLHRESRGGIPDLEIEIVAIERFASSGMQHRNEFASNSQSANHGIRATSFNLDSQRDPRTHIVFSLSAPELGRFCDVVLIHRTGEMETFRLDRTFSVSNITTTTPPENLETFILRYRPNQARVIFELPPLRGTPEINEDVDNLFDITLPHFRIFGGREMERAISGIAGVEFDLTDAVFSDDYFPRHYENVTLRALLGEYLAHHPDGERVRLDPSTHRLVVPERFSWKKKWRDFRKWMGI